MASFARNILEGLENQMTSMTTAAADMLKSARNTAVSVARYDIVFSPCSLSSQAKESAKATVKSIFKF
jgi:hypothetical protein